VADILADPSLAIATGETFWLTGLFKWMVSLDGRPSPHSILTGSWVPNALEISQGLTLGFGAVIALYHGETECSLLGNTLANARTSIYEELIVQLGVEETVLAGVESNHCQGAARASWPQ
jgi:hypothetical protein